MNIRWKAIEQYFTVVLFVNLLTPSKCFLSVNIRWKAVEQCFTVELFSLFPAIL